MQASEDNKNILQKKVKRNKCKIKKIVYEKYKDENILEFDKNSIHLSEPPSSMSLLKKKILAQQYFEEQKYNIEEILKYDNTNKSIQKEYLNIAVNKLENETKKYKKDIIKEKIEKCGIIVNKKDYEKEISIIKDKEMKKELKYRDYKHSLIDTLKYILNEQKNFKISEALNILNIRKEFYFNHESEIGENNYFFYLLSIQLKLKLDDLKMHTKKYDYIIKKSLTLLEELDFSKLSEQQKNLFEYVCYYLVVVDSINNNTEYESIYNFLEGKCVEENELKDAISKRNKKLDNEYKFYKEDINYKIEFNDKEKTLDYIIKEETKIDRKEYSQTHKLSYDYKIFNKNIIDIINKCKDNELEIEMFKNTVQDKSGEFLREKKKKINKIIKKILSSNAANTFFNKTYKKNYEKKYNKKIEYLFNSEEEQNEILGRISYFPLYNDWINGITNPSNLRIMINSIPGKFQRDDINLFNKNILQIGRIIIFAVHEIMVNYLRIYYSYITNREISMVTDEDDIIDTKPNGRINAEELILGRETKYLYLKEALCFFYSGEFEQFPLFENIIINKKILKNIIQNNIELFDFIEIGKDEEEKIMNESYEEKEDVDSNEDEDKKGNNIDNKKNAKITLSQYYSFFDRVPKSYLSIVSCRLNRNEIYILL